REIGGILGRLVLDILDAQRGAEQAFHNVSAEQRQVLFMLTNIPEFASIFYTGAVLQNSELLDDVTRELDEGELWFAGERCVEALDTARRALQELPPATLRNVANFDYKTPYGWIRIRGATPEVIDATDTWLIVDLAGRHTWRGAV